MTRKYLMDPEPQSSGPKINFESELNAEQFAAVTSPGGPSLVIAGAGSGKTRTLTYRVAWLLEQGIPAWNILLLTFTNKAAREMLERVSALVPGASDGIWGGTFHSVGNRILRRHADRIGFRPGFSIMDREDQEDLLEAVVAAEGLRTGDRRFPKGQVIADVLSYSVNTATPISGVLARKYHYFIPLTEQLELVHAAYEARKKEANSLDFDDLLIKVIELFQLCPDVAEQYQRQFQHILVDEYQDTNRVQAQVVDMLSQGHGNVMVVGDDAQSIYSWRGADFENILQFSKHYPGAVVHKIETNYRSLPEVLELANAAIEGNARQYRKNLLATREGGAQRPALVPLSTNTQQAAFVAHRILELHEEGVDFRDMAILYRAHFHSMETQLELTRRGIPFSITSGLRFFEQAHIKDVAAFMKLAVNPADELAFKRVVKLLPGIGAKSADTLWKQSQQALGGTAEFTRLHEACKPPAKAKKDWAQLVHTLEELVPKGVPEAPSKMIDSVVFALYDDYMQAKFSNYDARKEDLITLTNYARSFQDAGEFLSQLALLGNLETTDLASGNDEEADHVTLSTIHQAKGLEWKVVFLIWLTDGMFPSARSIEADGALEEERRLFYVGITRCKDELYLTYPDMRLNAGYGDTFQRPSRFLQELPESLMEKWEVGERSHAAEYDRTIDSSESE